MRGQTRAALLFAAITAVAVATTTAAFAGDNDSGFKTPEAAMVTCPTCDEVTPIITVGETMPGGYRFEAIPDGVALRARGNGRLDLYVNHETSTVPFPYNPAIAQTDPGESQNDFDNSQVSHLILNQHSKGVLSAKMAIPGSANYQRFCSNYMGTEAEGFDRPILFANEEAQDWVFGTTPRGQDRALSCRGQMEPSRPVSRLRTTCGPASSRPSTAWGGSTTRTPWRYRSTTASRS